MSNQNPNPQPEPVQDIRVLCTHLFEGSRRCASPALNGETFCYYHHPTHPRRETRAAWRIARRNFSVHTPTDREQLRDTLTCVLQAIADNRVKIPHARRILYGLQQVGLRLEKVESTFHPTLKSANINSHQPSTTSRGPK